MTANIPSVLFNFLALAFFVVIALGIALGAYAARSLRRAEQQMAVVEAPVTPTVFEPMAPVENPAEASND